MIPILRGYFVCLQLGKKNNNFHRQLFHLQFLWENCIALKELLCVLL